MSANNGVHLLGRLTADPELKTTVSGVSVCQFSVAVPRSYAKKSEERQTDFSRVWHGAAARNLSAGTLRKAIRSAFPESCKAGRMRTRTGTGARP